VRESGRPEQARVAGIDGEPAAVVGQVHQHATQPSRPPMIALLDPVHGALPFTQFRQHDDQLVGELAASGYVLERVFRASLFQRLLQAAAQVGLARGRLAHLLEVLVERLQPLRFLLRAQHRAAGVERFLVQAGPMAAHLQPLERGVVVGREP